MGVTCSNRYRISLAFSFLLLFSLSKCYAAHDHVQQIITNSASFPIEYILTPGDYIPGWRYRGILQPKEFITHDFNGRLFSAHTNYILHVRRYTGHFDQWLQKWDKVDHDALITWDIYYNPNVYDLQIDVADAEL